MKEGIHPDYREVVFADLQTGSKFITRSTVQTRETIELDGKTYPLFKCDVTSNRTCSTRAPRPASSKPAAWKVPRLRAHRRHGQVRFLILSLPSREPQRKGSLRAAFSPARLGRH